MDPEPRKILIVRTSALGDIVHVLPSLAALRELYPRAKISWFLEPAGAGLLQGHPDLERLFVFDRARWKREWRRPPAWPRLAGHLAEVVGAMRTEEFDLVIDFQCNVRSGLATLLSGGKRRLGFARADCPEWGGRLYTNRKAPRCPRGLHKVEKNLWLIRALGWEGSAPPRPTLPIADGRRRWARSAVDALPGSGPVLLVHPAVSRFGEFKRWGEERYRELLQRARSEIGARAIVSWGPGERDLAERIGEGTIAPQTSSPQDLAALIAASDVVVASDTGALHIAAALDVPAVGLYGPKDPNVYGPYPVEGCLNRSVRSGVPCSPCRLRRCEHRICMTTLAPESVLAAIRDVLSLGARA